MSSNFRILVQSLAWLFYLLSKSDLVGFIARDWIGVEPLPICPIKFVVQIPQAIFHSINVLVCRLGF